jgi:hypothetical protein
MEEAKGQKVAKIAKDSFLAFLLLFAFFTSLKKRLNRFALAIAKVRRAV